MNQAITITFGDCAENHAGMQIVGDMASRGLSPDELKISKNKLEQAGYECEMICLNDAIEGDGDPAFVLIIRNGVKAFIEDDDLYSEMVELDVDTKAFMRGRVVNKRARYNLVYGPEAQEPNYENKMGRIIPYSEIPIFNKLRKSLPSFFGEISSDLWGEGNYYYDPKKCGIGFHGDTERRIVIAVRLGASIPLHYQWFERHKPIGERVVINLENGDMYAMSEKAVGYDWKKSSRKTLRHSAGCRKYTTIKK